MDVLYGCEASTIQKYTKIICRILNSHEGLFSKYILVPTGNRLQDIIDMFKDVTRFSNICGAINGTHIPLTRK